MSERSWVVGRVSRDGSVIYSLQDPDADSAAAKRRRSGSDDDSDDDDEVPPLAALLEVMQAAGMGNGRNGELSDAEM